MAIHLITGIPGHGKTAQLMDQLLKDIAANDIAIKEGKEPRPLFVAGVDGIAEGLAEPLTDPTSWCYRVQIGTKADGKPAYEYRSNLPHGAKVYVDEAWKWFGHLDGSGRETPVHVLGLAEHRHFGIDFVWTAQGTGQMWPFLRPLVSPHWHCVRFNNTLATTVYRWNELCDDVKSETARARADAAVVVIPKRTFGLYKSASVHTMKARIPWKLALIPLCFVAAVVLGWSTWKLLAPDAVAADEPEAANAGLPASPLASGVEGTVGGEDAPLTGEQWLARLTPRFPGLPESAPIFDGREVQAIPRRFCVISGHEGDQRCNCYTEQMTPIREISPGVCLQVARWGEYDPFRGPLETERGMASGPEPAPSAVPATPGVVGVTTPPTVLGSPDAGTVQGLPPATLR